MDFIKFKISTLWKAIFKKSKYKPQTGRKNFCQHTSNKDSASNMQRTLTQTTPLKIGRDMNKHLAKEDVQLVYKNILNIIYHCY